MPSRASWRGAEPGLSGPRDRFDQIAARRADPSREPERETVRGEAPGRFEIGALGDQGIRRPYGDLAPLQRGAKLGLGRAHGEALPQACHRPGELIHGEQRHAVRRPLAEAELGLASAHLVGQGPSPRHHDDGPRAPRRSHPAMRQARPSGPRCRRASRRPAARRRQRGQCRCERVSFAAALIRPRPWRGRSRRRPRPAPCRASRS